MIDNALDYEGLQYYDEKSKKHVEDKIIKLQNDIQKTYKEKTMYANGSEVSINDLIEDDTYRIYVAKDTADHDYLGFYGQVLVETFIQSGVIYQRINRVSNGDIYMRYSSNQNTTPLSYETTLMKINNTADIQELIKNKVDKVDGKGLSTNDYTTEEKNKLGRIADGAEVNQNAFGKVAVGAATINANAKTDTLILEGNNVTVTSDETSDKVVFDITKENVISALGYTPSEGTSATNRRFALVGQTGSTTTNPWYKFASINIPNARQDYDITFMVRRTFGNNYLDDMGILRAHVRADANIECEVALLEWLTVTPSINLSNFVLSYANHLTNNPGTTPTSSLMIELWVKCDLAYSMWNFDVLSEGNRLNNAEYWTLYSTMTAGSESEVGFGNKIESTVLDLGQNVNSATKINATVNNNTSLLSYLIPYFDGNSTGKKELKMNDGFLYKANIGTASSVGRSALILGNATPEGTDGNSTGSMIIYGSDKYYTQLSSQKQTSDRSIVFPDASGTTALISNVPWTRSSGTAADHRIVGVHGFVSDLGKQVMLYIPMIFDRSVSYNSTLTISKLLCDIRTVEGALLGGGYDANLTQYVTETYIYVHQGLIRITLVKEDGWGVTNNTPLCGDCTIDYSIL